MTDEQRERKNARQRARYAMDTSYREALLTKQRERDATPEGRAKKLARKKRWQAANRERYLEQTRRQGAKRRLNPNFAEDARRRAREWRENNPVRWYETRVLAPRGLTIADYVTLLRAQRNRCAICKQHEIARWANGRRKRLAVDHDHATNQVRALLCSRCNTAIGQMADDPELLRAAANYLEAYA